MAHSDEEALILAARIGDEETLTLLLEQGTDPDCANHRNMTPLHEAAKRNYPGVARLLLAAKASPDIKDETGDWTPLHHAAAEGHTEVTRCLIEASATVTTRDNVNDTPLHEAVRYSHSEVVELLLRARASVNASNNLRVSPLHVATRAVDTTACALRDAAAGAVGAAGAAGEVLRAVDEAAAASAAATALLTRVREAADTEAINAATAVAEQLTGELMENALVAAFPRRVDTAAVDPTFDVGAEVVLHSLSAAHLNGAIGAVLGLLNRKGRLPVRLAEPHAKGILLKPANLCLRLVHDTHDPL